MLSGISLQQVMLSHHIMEFRIDLPGIQVFDIEQSRKLAVRDQLTECFEILHM